MTAKTWLRTYGLELCIVAISLSLTTWAVWYKVGVNQHVPLYEEWGIVHLFESGEPFIPTKNFPGRPLRAIPFWLVYEISPDFILGLNIYLLGLFVGRGIFTYLIGRELFPETKFMAFSTALIFLLYPAGTGYFTFRALPVHSAWVIGLASTWLFLHQARQPRRWLWILIWSTQILSLLIYELLYVPFALLPLVLWWIAGRVDLSKQFRQNAILWYSFYSFLAGRYAYLVSTGQGGYLNQRIDHYLHGQDLLTLAINNMVKMYTDHISGWLDSWLLIQGHEKRLLASMGMSLLISGLLYLLLVNDPPSPSQSPRMSVKRYGSAIVYSLLFMSVGYITYALIGHIEKGYRVYFVTSLGASFAISLGLYLSSYLFNTRWRNGFLSLVLIYFLIPSIGQTMHKNETYAKQSWAVQRLFEEIVTQVPNPTPDTIILVVDDGLIYQDEKIAGISAPLWMALEYIYGRDIEAYICRLDKIGNRDQCLFHETYVEHVSGTIWGKHNLAYENLVAFSTTMDGHIFLLNTLPYGDEPHDNYQPFKLTSTSQALPDRADEFFTCLPLHECDPYQSEIIAASSFRLDFNQPFAGTGWELYQANRERRWMIGQRATIAVYLVPHQPYQLSFQGNVLDPAVFDGLEVWVNGERLDLLQTGSPQQADFQGNISADMVSEYTLVEFRVKHTTVPKELGINADERELAIHFEWLEIVATGE